MEFYYLLVGLEAFVGLALEIFLDSFHSSLNESLLGSCLKKTFLYLTMLVCGIQDTIEWPTSTSYIYHLKFYSELLYDKIISCTFTSHSFLFLFSKDNLARKHKGCFLTFMNGIPSTPFILY